jgi:hypothetical protein
LAGPEHSTLRDVDIKFHEGEYKRLLDLLQSAHEASSLPDLPTAGPALNDLLIRIRMSTRS